MAITKIFTPLKKPAQFVYAGEKHLEVWSLAKGKYKSTKVLEDSNIFDMSSQDFANVKPGLPGGNVSVGLVLNSGNFIFNVFEFEKIPLLEERQKDLVEWRVQKVFPEKIELYDHQFFRISKNKVLSVLFKKELLERVEKLFKDNGLELIFALDKDAISFYCQPFKRVVSYPVFDRSKVYTVIRYVKGFYFI